MTNTLHPAYTNGDFFLLWKPRNLASTRGDHPSLIELVQTESSHPGVDCPEALLSHFESFLSNNSRTEVDRSQTTAHLRQQWTSEQEFGLLNRLDTPTGGFLTFAANPKAKEDFLVLQRQGSIDKHYLAYVSGNPKYLVEHPESVYPNLKSLIKVQGNNITVSVPLKHHRHLDDRMVAIKSDNDLSKGRDGLLECTTDLSVLEGPRTYNTTSPDSDGSSVDRQVSLVQCVITKGQRHQIRVHCQTLGYPVVGDTLYGKDKEGELELWSMGYEAL